MRNLGSIGYRITVIDERNWRDYVDLPDYVIRRRERRQIPSAHFTDLLRLELLIRYGGTWIDSTVLCTGFKFQVAGGGFVYVPVHAAGTRWRGRIMSI